MGDKRKLLKKAYEIAVADLRANYGRLGIYAGPKNHHEYWARDSFFASFGSLSLGDTRVVKKNLDLFTKYQNAIGHIPLRVEERFHSLGVLGINLLHKKPKPVFKPSQPWAGEVIDSNPLYLILVCEYVKKTGDVVWVKKNSQKIMNAVSWLVGKFNERNLVTEGFNAGWADFTFKRGNVLYTNILVWRAFKLLCDALPADGAKHCSLLTKKMEDAIKKNLWDKKRGYFIDHIGKHGKKHKVFASDGNLLAILFGLATKRQGKEIIRFIDKHQLSRIPVPIYFPSLEWKHKVLNNIFFTSYNTKNTFTWWGSISALCRLKMGDAKGALNDLNALAKIINKYQSVPEIVDPRGDLVRSLFYKTELQSSWAAGMFVYAFNKARRMDLI